MNHNNHQFTNKSSYTCTRTGFGDAIGCRETAKHKGSTRALRVHDLTRKVRWSVASINWLFLRISADGKRIWSAMKSRDSWVGRLTLAYSHLWCVTSPNLPMHIMLQLSDTSSSQVWHASSGDKLELTQTLDHQIHPGFSKILPTSKRGLNYYTHVVLSPTSLDVDFGGF